MSTPNPKLAQLDLGDGQTRDLKDSSAVNSVSVNGVHQTITNGATDLDIASNLITDTQWTSIESILV